MKIVRKRNQYIDNHNNGDDFVVVYNQLLLILLSLNGSFVFARNHWVHHSSENLKERNRILFVICAVDTPQIYFSSILLCLSPPVSAFP